MSQFVGQNVDGTYGNNVDWTKSWNGGINPNGMYTKGLLNETSTPVVCKDGSKKMQPSSPNARYMDVCRDNGGVDNQKTNDNAIKLMTDGGMCLNSEGKKVGCNTLIANVPAPALPTKSGSSVFKKLAGAYNKNLIIAVVLIGGYFAYKKFKK